MGTLLATYLSSILFVMNKGHFNIHYVWCMRFYHSFYGYSCVDAYFHCFFAVLFVMQHIASSVLDHLCFRCL